MAGISRWCDNPECIHRGHVVLEETNNVVVNKDDLRSVLGDADHGGAYFNPDHSYMARLWAALED